MESNSAIPVTCRKEDNLNEVTNIKVNSKQTNKIEKNSDKIKDRETNSVKAKRVSFHIVPAEKINLKINTIQNIYNSNAEAVNDDTIGNLSRSNSLKNRINKSAYLKLHRHSLLSAERSSVGKLKGKYENIAKQTDNNLKSNNIVVPTKPNTDNTSTNNPGALINSEDRLPNECETIKESVVPKDHPNILQESPTESSKPDVDEQKVHIAENEHVKTSTDYFLKTTSTIEKLQNNLSTKLSKETIEQLRNKYSPANYAKSITTNKLELQQQHSSKLPVPTPRTLLTPVLPSKFERVSETPKNKEVESFTVKLVTLDDVPQQVNETKNETAPPVTEEIKHDNTKTNHVSNREAKIEDKKNNEQVSVNKNDDSLPINEHESHFETLEVTYGNIEFAEPEERHLIVRRSSSEDSINKVESFLSEIIMEKRPKEKKRSNSFKKLAAGFFSRDKKKSDADKAKHKKDNGVFTDNAQNESQAFDRHSSHRHTTDNSFSKLDMQKKNSYYHNTSSSPMHYSSSPPHRNSSDNSNLRGRYTEMNGTNGPLFKSNRTHIHAGQDYVPMDSSNLQNSKNVQSNYINVGKHGDTSSSSSNTLDSEIRNCTYQNALIAQAEMRQIQINENLQRQSKHNKSLNLNKKTFPDLDNCPSNDSLEHYSRNELEYMQLVKPKALIPINSERPLPNPYHNNHDSEEKFNNVDNGKTIDRNLNTSNSKPYPYKNDVYNKVEDPKENKVVVEELYGTVFDSITPTRLIENNSKLTPSLSSELSIKSDSSSSYKSQLSPKSVESSKLRLPSNRQKVDLQPRIRSPLPQNKVSTDKIIATELLRNSKSPTRNSPIFMEDKKTNTLTQVQRSPQVSLNRQTNYRKDYRSVDNRNTTDSVDSFQYSPSTDSVGLNLNSPVLRNRDNQAAYHQIRISDLEQHRMSDVERNRVSNVERNRREVYSPSFERSNITTNAVIHKNPEERISSNSSLPTLSRGVSPQQMQKPMYFNYDKSPSNASLNSSLSNVRSYTPTQKLPVASSPKSPEKQHIINNVEAFYWRELKKLKYKEEHELAKYRQNQLDMYGYVEDPGVTRRSRSVSPSLHRGQRSLSLPRDGRGNIPSRGDNRVIVIRENGIYASGRHVKNGPEAIPEGRPVIAKQPITLPSDSTYGQVGHPSFQRNPHFVRNTFERSTIGPIGTNKSSRVYENYYPPQDSRQICTPIFKRGSLTGNLNVADSQLSKKVSFNSTSNSNSVWPTKNGYTRSPPTRRIERESMNDDDVFFPNSPRSPRNAHENMNSAPKYGYVNSNTGIYYSRPDQSVVDYGGQSLRSLPQQDVEPIYVGRPKQITVSNRVCDIYGRIHDADQKPDSNQRVLSATRNYGEVKQIGLVYGQLQPNTMHNQEVPMHQNYNQTSSPNLNFVRGTRLTASANDMYKRYPHDPSHYQFDQRYQNEGPYSHEKVSDVPNRPLPPIPHKQNSRVPLMRKVVRENVSASNIESGSEMETNRVYYPRTKQKNFNTIEEEWNSDGKLGRGSGNESGGSRGDNEGEIKSSRSRSARREDPRRHTLSGDQHYGMSAQGGPLSRTMDLEGQFMRGYPPSSNAMLFDDDPGIMSEVETSSTGFRRGGKQRSSLPVVRTPSKTLERPLGLVFLQYRNETKRALLPNEITSIDTVKALFVRSFPKQLSMEYLDSPLVKIYIHDSSKDMFYELEDVRSHLREIRDRSVLRLFESTDVSGGLPMGGVGIPGGVGHFEDPSYFSEPEFDSEYQHQHIHKSKGSTGKSAPYYMGSTSSLPRGAPLLRPYSPAVSTLPSDRMKTLPADGYMSSPERGSRGYEDPYYSQYTSRSGSITPVIDEEISDTELLDEQYSLYGVKIAPGGPRSVRPQFPGPAAPPYDATRLRVEHMERQLANLTGLVQKALTQTPAPRDFLAPPGRDAYRSDDSYLRTDSIKAPKLGKSCHKSVSFEKSVSFSDEPPDMNSPKQHSPQHTEKDRLKPAPPPKPASLSPGQYDGRHIYRDLQLTPEMYNQLRGLQKKAKDLRSDVRNLRRMSQAQAHSVRETIRDTFIKIRAMLVAGGEQVWQAGLDQERVRLSRDEDLYKQEMLRLEKDLTDLEGSVEELRGNVINRKTRVNMSDVENMALVLSKSSKTVADLKLRFPGLQDTMKSFLTSEMDKVVREEKFLKEEPERLESALRRCKKLTGTLVTLKRLASVQEQRLPCATGTPDGRISPTITETPPVTPTSGQHSKPPSGARVGQVSFGGDSSNSTDSSQRPENALDALLDELQTFSKPHSATVNTQMPQAAYSDSTPSDPPAIPVKGIAPSHSAHFSHPHMSEIGRKGSMDSASILPTQNLTVSTATGSLRRLHSYPSGSDTDNSPPIQPPRNQLDGKSFTKPPIPERNAELLHHITSGRRVPPPPPPRTSSKSPLASPTSPSLPPRSPATGLQHIQNVQNMTEKPQSQFETATQNLGLSTLRRNVPNRSSIKDNKAQTLPRNIGSNLQIHTQVVATGTELQNVSSSSCESVNSQDGTKKGSRKEELEQRHQELLKKQKALQEQYARLQQLQRGNNTLVAVVPPTPDQLLKKTGSESNLLQKMGLQMATTQMTGSLTNLPSTTANAITNQPSNTVTTDDNSSSSSTTTSKVYETDIL